jgi:spore germination protein YaaH
MSIDQAGNLHANDDARMRRVLAAAIHRPWSFRCCRTPATAWDGAGTARALANPARRAALVQGVDQFLDKTGDGGVMVDFENMPEGSLGLLRQFVADLHARLAPKHRWYR